MKVTCEGKEYEIIFGSDVDDDGFFAECTAEGKSDEVLLYAFWSDAGEGFTFSAFKEDLPFELVETFVIQARKRLPPAENVLSPRTN